MKLNCFKQCNSEFVVRLTEKYKRLTVCQEYVRNLQSTCPLKKRGKKIGKRSAKKFKTFDDVGQ